MTRFRAVLLYVGDGSILGQRSDASLVRSNVDAGWGCAGKGGKRPRKFGSGTGSGQFGLSGRVIGDVTGHVMTRDL